MVRRTALSVAWLGTAAGLLVGSPALAQRMLTLDEALQLAHAHNRDLRAARARLEESATNIEQARAALLPQVATQGKYTHNYKEVTLNLAAALNQGTLGLADAIRSSSGNAALNNGISGFEQSLSAATAARPPIVIQKGEQLDVGVNATIPLVVPYAYPALASAKETHAANSDNYFVTEAAVLLSVAQTFYAGAGADELVLARSNAIAIAKQTLDDAKARFQAGTATSVDVMRAEVAVVRAEQAEAEAEDARAQAYRSLATLLGTREPLRATPAEAATAAPPSVGELVESALHLRPEFAFYQHSLEATASSARSWAWRWAPTLSAFGGVHEGNYQSYSGDKYYWLVGLQLDWTLYDGGSRDAQRHLASAQQSEYEARLELLRDTVTDEVLNALRALDTKRRALDSAVRSSNLSRETLRLVRAQYEAGTATQLDLLQAQDSQVSSDVAVAQARFDLAVADLQLRRDAGLFPATRTAP